MTPAEAANLPRFDGRAPFYEVWFVEAQDVDHKSGLWLRWTLSAPIGGQPIAELWGIFFDRRDPSKTFGLKKTVPFGEAHLSRERFQVVIAGAELTQYGCRGSLGDLSWDLTWSEDQLLVHYPYDRMYRGAFPKTKVLSPHFDLRAGGTYSARGDSFQVREAPGQQSHLWGSQHAERWRWAHVNTFSEDPSAAFEALTAQVKIGPFSPPALTFYALRWRGKNYLFNKPQDLLYNNESRLDAKDEPDGYYPPSVWTVGGGSAELRFRGELWAERTSYAGVRYRDPDGSERICNHSKVASARLEVLEPDGKDGWRVAAKLTSDGSAALEFVGREADPHVPLKVP